MSQPSPVPSFENRRCLVTGGAGFIGSNLTRALLAAGASVTVLDNFSVGRREHLPASPRLEVVEGDVRTLPDLAGLVRGRDYVFHLAAQVGNVKSIKDAVGDASTNVLGTVRLVDACRGQDVHKVVYASSSAIFGEALTPAVAEDHPQAPASFYALSKLTAEKYARLAHELWGVPAVCLRYFNVFGLPMEDNEYTGVISIFLNRLAVGSGLTVFGDGEQSRDFVHVDDVVQANMLAAARGPAGTVYNVGSGQPTTVTELARAAMQVAGRKVAVRYEPPRAGEVRHSLADIGRAREVLGYEPGVDLASGLREMWRRVVAETAAGGV